MTSVAEIWMGLTADSRQSVCDALASYSGPDVGPWFAGLVKLAHGKQVAMGSTTQMEPDGKRKRDDGSDVAQPPCKKVRFAEATASSNSFMYDFSSPAFGQSSFPFGEPTFSSTRATASSSVAPLSPPTPFNTAREYRANSPVIPASSTAIPALNLTRSNLIKLENSATKLPSYCDKRSASPDPAPRKLKCIQCKQLYIETENTSKECRRHTGRCLHVDDQKFDYQDLPSGTDWVWDCCRRKADSRGCYPCNHYAG